MSAKSRPLNSFCSYVCCFMLDYTHKWPAINERMNEKFVTDLRERPGSDGNQ